MEEVEKTGLGRIRRAIHVRFLEYSMAGQSTRVSMERLEVFGTKRGVLVGC